MAANAPQAWIAAQIVVCKEAAENAVKRSGAPRVTSEQVCRLLRTTAALTVSTAALERSMVRHQHKPVPFFGTVLTGGIDVPALAAGWGGAGLLREGGEGLGTGVGSDLGVPAAETAPRSSALGQAKRTGAPPGQDARRKALVGQDFPAMTGEPAEAMQPDPAMTEDSGPDDDTEAPGGDGEGTDGPMPSAMAGSTERSGVGGKSPGMSAGGQGLPAMARDMAVAMEQGPATTENLGPDAGATCGVVTRLDQGPGWTLDVVRRRMVDQVVGDQVVRADIVRE
ncbi:MAG TPA: hypothetical protein VFE41_25295 [Acetobacteraceae bacterium]|jgi:hypothetical protein|nr:hypothetical protein [Acetobacteraceae bacterium]